MIYPYVYARKNFPSKESYTTFLGNIMILPRCRGEHEICCPVVLVAYLTELHMWQPTFTVFNNYCNLLSYFACTLGIATRQCNQNGVWESPDVTECRTVEQIRLEMRAEELDTLVENMFVGDDRDLTEVFMPEVIVDIADDLNEITNTSTPLLPNDVTSTANTLNIIIS